MPKIAYICLAAGLICIAGSAHSWAQPATKPAAAPAPAKPHATPQLARDPLQDYPASKAPGVIFVGPRTMSFLKRLGPEAVFFTSKAHPLERLVELTDTDSQFGAWGIPPFTPDDLFNLKFMFGGKPEHLHMIGNLNFPKLFQQNPKLRLFVTSSKIPFVEAIERDGGGMKISLKLFDAAAATAPGAPAPSAGQSCGSAATVVTGEWGETFGRLKLTAYKFGANTPSQVQVFGANFINMFSICKNGAQLTLSPDIPDANGIPAFKGVLWSSTDRRSGYIWTPRVEQFAGMDLSENRKIVDQPSFSFDSLQKDGKVIEFANGFGINLYGAVVDAGSVVQAGTALGYAGADGKRIPGRLIKVRNENGKQIFDEVIY
jgi:hypothetical protein